MALLQRINSSLSRNGPEPEPPPSSDARSAGDDLRRQREVFGLELEDVEAALKIRRRYLAAIEDGRTDFLPGAAYAIGFVRAYSAYLGLDSGEILRRFKLEASGFGAKPDLAFPVPLGEPSMPGRGVVVAGLVAAICAYAVWYYWSVAERVVPERVTEVPATLSRGEFSVARSPAGVTASLPAAPPTHSNRPPATSMAAPPTDQGQSAFASPRSSPPVPTASPASQEPKVVGVGAEPGPVSAVSGAGPGAAPTDAAVLATRQSPPAAAIAAPAAAADAPAPAPALSNQLTPAPITGAGVSNPAAGAPKPTAAVPVDPRQALAAPAAAEPNQAARVLGAADSPSRIVLRATADSWIQIREADHTVLFTGVLKAGDTYRVPDRPGLVMRAGNAGGLDILVNGKPAPSLGRMGAVRNVMLDPQSLTAENSTHD